jgi:hypothetical protein
VPPNAFCYLFIFQWGIYNQGNLIADGVATKPVANLTNLAGGTVVVTFIGKYYASSEESACTTNHTFTIGTPASSCFRSSTIQRFTCPATTVGQGGIVQTLSVVEQMNEQCDGSPGWLYLAGSAVNIPSGESLFLVCQKQLLIELLWGFFFERKIRDESVDREWKE